MKKKNASTKRKPPQGLKAPKEDYQPLNLRLNWEARDVCREYSRLRSIYRKRLERLQKSEYSNISLMSDRPITRYKPIKQIKSERELQHLLSELAYLIDSRVSTITGNREIDKMRMGQVNEKYGLNIKTREELNQFGEFMEHIREYATDRIYDSDFAADLFASKDETTSTEELIKLYHEFLKTGSRNIEHLRQKQQKQQKRKRATAKTKRKKRKR